MKSYRVLLADVPSPTYLAWIEERLPQELELVAPKIQDDEALLEQVREADCIVTRRRTIDRSIIEAGERLRFIQAYGLTRNVVDLKAAEEAGVQVAGMPLAGCVAVAELAITLMLALSKNLIVAHDATSSAAYRALGLEPKPTSERSHAFQWMQIPMTEVYDRTLGIVGYGEIGMEVAKRAQAFDMRVLYTKRRRLARALERRMGIEFRPLSELLQESDFVSLHTPHSAQTEKLIGRRELALMKPSSFLINTCRGGVVDEDALCEALSTGGIAGAGLDVFREEPLPADSCLRELPNVILTPHVGGGSGAPNLYREIRDILSNVARAARGEEPLHLLSRKDLYDSSN